MIEMRQAYKKVYLGSVKPFVYIQSSRNRTDYSCTNFFKLSKK